MFWIQLVVVTGVIFVIAAVVLGAGGSLPDAYREQPELRMPADRPLTSADIDHIRFPVVLRGYRMSEVDDALDRLTGELAARDARILELEYKVAGTAPEGIMVAVPAGATSAAAARGTTDPGPLAQGRTTPSPRAGRGPSLEKTVVDERFVDEQFVDQPTTTPEPAEPTPVTAQTATEAVPVTDTEPDTTEDEVVDAKQTLEPHDEPGTQAGGEANSTPNSTPDNEAKDDPKGEPKP